MKVLFISNFYDGTGYSQAAIDWALCMDYVGIDVVVRNIKLNNEYIVPPQRILELQEKNDENCDIVIQYTLPHLMSYNRKAGINIGMFDYETTNFINSSWADKLNVMDYIFVPSQDQKEACIRSGVSKEKIFVIHHTTNQEKYLQQILPLENKELKDKFIFYFIGEFNRRKNFGALVKAFHTAFDNDENVELLLKTHIPGKSPQETVEIIRKFCDEIKIGLKKYHKLEDYKQEIIVTDRLSEEDLLRLHKSCHCFACASHGEGWCQPLIDAMGIGNIPMACDFMGLREILTSQNAYNVIYSIDNCFGVVDNFADLYTNQEMWCYPAIEELSYNMRLIYDTFKNEKEYYNSKSLAAMKTMEKFNYKTVGNQIKEVLNAITN